MMKKVSLPQILSIFMGFILFFALFQWISGDWLWAEGLIFIGIVLLMCLVVASACMLQVLCWVQIFLIGTGRGLKETYSHYIYMIPEFSFKKIVWSNMEMVVRILIENVLIFGVAGLLLQSHILYILVCIAVYTLFSFLLLGVNYLSMRFTGANISAAC